MNAPSKSWHRPVLSSQKCWRVGSCPTGNNIQNNYDRTGHVSKRLRRCIASNSERHDGSKKLFSIQKEAKKFTQELNLPNLDKRAHAPTAKFAKRAKQKAQHQAQDFLEKQWEDKAIHGKYLNRVKDADVDCHKTNWWLKSSGLKAETEGLITAAQDQSLATISYHARIIKDNTSPMCRMCNKYEETVDNIVSGYPKLAQTEYIHRYDKAAAYIHWKVCLSYNIKTSEKRHDHTPEMVTESEDTTILWNMQILTACVIAANKPDIVIKDHKTMTCKLINMVVPSYRNTSAKVMEKLSKYKDLEIEVTRMWGMSTETVPVVIGAPGVIKKGLGEQTGKIPGSINISKLQKIMLLGTGHILRRVLSTKWTCWCLIIMAWSWP